MLASANACNLQKVTILALTQAGKRNFLNRKTFSKLLKQKGHLEFYKIRAHEITFKGQHFTSTQASIMPTRERKKMSNF